MIQQIQQLNRTKAIPINDAISGDVVGELVSNGYAKLINGVVFLPDNGKKVAISTYTGNKKWLKKGKDQQKAAKVRKFHRLKAGK